MGQAQIKGLECVDESLVLQRLGAEVEKKAGSQTTRLKVIKDLSFLCSAQGRQRFYFHN